MQKKIIQPIDQVKPFLLQDMRPDDVRSHVLEMTRNFKNSWRNLAQALHIVWSQKLYRHWDYDTFDQYTAKEVCIRKNTAIKLIRSYMFLEREEPTYFEHLRDDEESRKIMPSLEAVGALQRAKKALAEEDYQKVRKDLLEVGRDPQEVKKDLTVLIMKRRNDLSPQDQRTHSRKVAINHFLSTLRQFKNQIDTLKILPGVVGDDIEALIKKIEKHTAS